MIGSKKNNSWLTKKILKIILWFWIFSLLFFWLNNKQHTYAQYQWIGPQQPAVTETATAQEALDKALQETKSLLDIVLKMIYMISWPLLVIAGSAMDNSLVYWSFFHLDAPLRKFWNIMKNFANYALWFVLLYHILRSLFSWKWVWSFSDKDSPLWIVKKILIAGILIQASRFLLSAVIDISTITTYAIGGMPLTVLKNSDLWDQKVLWVNSTINLADTNNLEDTVIYRTYWDNPERKIANCKIWSWWNSSYIVGKQINFISQSWSNNSWWIPLEKWICVLWGIPYRFNEFNGLSSVTTNAGYDKTIEEIIASNPNLDWFEECWFIIPIFSKLKYDENNNCLTSGTPLALKDFWYQWWSWRLNSIAGTTISTLIDKSKWFVWPLITIYSSTLNFGQLIDTDWWWDSLTFGIVLKFMIKTLIAIMLILPVLALAVIMLARIWILWIVIAFTPLLIIDQVFEFKIFDKMEYLKMWNIIKLIFAPVLIVFGLSMALIFMSTLSNILSQNKTDFENPWIKTQKESTLEWLWITQNKAECYTVLWTRTFCTKLNLGGWLDNISYLLINIFGIAMMRALLFWTIQQSWKIWEQIGNKVKWFWQNVAGNIPIIPIWWWSMVWVNQIAWSQWLFSQMWSKISWEMSKANQQKMAERFDRYDQTNNEDKTKKEENKEINPPITTAQVNSIVAEATKWTKIDETQLKTLIWWQVEADKIKWWITARVKEPENVRLLFAEFEKQNPSKTNQQLKDDFEKTLPVTLLDIKPIKEYKGKFDKNEFAIVDMIKNLNNKLLEALVVIPIWPDITAKDGKYKITKKSDWKYESTPA